MEKKRKNKNFIVLALAGAMLLLSFMASGRNVYADEADAGTSDQGASVLQVEVYKEDLPYAQAPLRLMKFEGSFPTVVASLKTDQNGICEIGDFAPNALYEILMEDHKIKFDIDKVRFRTNEQGRVIRIRDKQILSESDNRIEFRGYRKDENVLKTQSVEFYTFDKESALPVPVEGVELTANVILPKLSSYKTVKSNEQGIVKFELEGQAEGKIYVVTISKNGRFLWESDESDMMITVKDDGVEYSSEPIFYVRRNDRRYLKDDLRALISEAEQYMGENEFTDAKALEKLQKYIDTAKAELAKETIPEYVEGFIQGIRESMEELKQYEKKKPAPEEENKEKEEPAPEEENKEKEESVPEEEPKEEPKESEQGLHPQEPSGERNPAEPEVGGREKESLPKESIPLSPGQKEKEEKNPPVLKEEKPQKENSSLPKTENIGREQKRSSSSAGNSSSGRRGGGIVRKNELQKDSRGRWIKNEKGWWYRRADASYPSNGWMKLEKSWYHFNQEGYMSVGWINWKGEWYYLDTDGKMLSDTITPDGYRLGANGAWMAN